MIIDSTQYNGMCACGREHKMETVLSVVECGCLREFDRYASQLGIQGCRTAVYDENTYRAIADGIDLKHIIYALNNAGKTLQTHTGINIFIFQFRVGTVTHIIELGKYVVPNFHKTVAVATRLAIRRMNEKEKPPGWAAFDQWSQFMET